MSTLQNFSISHWYNNDSSIFLMKVSSRRAKCNPLTGRLLNFQTPPEQYIASVKWKFSDSFTFRTPQQME